MRSLQTVRDAPPENEQAAMAEVQETIAENLFATLRGKDNLVFANARRDVEEMSDILRRMCEKSRAPVEFFPHHGSISKELREEVESLLRNKSRPVSVVCTNTLELGIDIGSVHSIAQVGAPPSVSALRQRLGRSGRRQGESSILRCFCSEQELTANDPLWNRLRAGLFQSVAMVELLLERWCEPPDLAQLHLSTLVQQILSTIAQFGGAPALKLYRLLCENGPFRAVTREMFLSLLRELGSREIISQAGDKTLLLGNQGEKIVNHYTFYAAFSTPEEFRLEANGRAIGSMPISSPLKIGEFLIFAGRRWRITTIDEQRKVINLKRAKGGRAPRFDGEGAPLHDRVVEKMREIYMSAETPIYLDPIAAELFRQGRQFFNDMLFQQRSVLTTPDSTWLFPWCGTVTLKTLHLLLQQAGLEIENHRIALRVKETTPSAVQDTLFEIVKNEKLDPHLLVSHLGVKAKEKYDHLLGEELLDAECASRTIRLDAGQLAAGRLANDRGWNNNFDFDS